MVMLMIVMKIVIIITIGTKIVFRKSIPYCNLYKSGGKSKAKR